MRLITLTMLFLLAFCAHAELFKWVDADGNIMYSDQPPPGAAKKEHQVDEETLPPIITTPALETPAATPQADSTAFATNPDQRYKSPWY